MKKIFVIIVLSSFLGFNAQSTLAQTHKHVKTTVKYRKPWSRRAKGAAIGGGTGAVVGGLAGHSVKGALIGGALGAGAGYVIGNETDKNKSRTAKERVVKRKTITSN